MIKKSKKYNYIQGKQLTDPGTGTRVYDIDNYRLPSVTTILGATKNQDFIDVTLSSGKKADIVEMILDRKRKEIMKKNNDKKK